MITVTPSDGGTLDANSESVSFVGVNAVVHVEEKPKENLPDNMALATDKQSYTYGDTVNVSVVNKAEGATVKYVVNGGTPADSVSIKDAGTYTISAVVSKDGYNDKTLDPITVTIGKKDVTISDIDLEKTYDGKNTIAVSEGDATVDGILNSEVSFQLADEVALDSADVGDRSGTAAVTWTGDAQKNYNLPKEAKVNVTVDPKPITLSVNNASIHVDEATKDKVNTLFTVMVDGLVDASHDVSSFVIKEFKEKTLGDFIVTPVWGDNANYVVAENGISIGTLSVVDKTYTDFAFAYSEEYKTTYVEGQKFDPTGMTITATYYTTDEAATATEVFDDAFIKNSFTIDPETFSITPGKEEETVSVDLSYGGYTEPVEVKVIKKALTKIEAEHADITYLEGVALTEDNIKANITVVPTYNDDKNEPALESFSIVGWNGLDLEDPAVGNYTLTVEAGGMTDTVNVTIRNKVLTSIEISGEVKTTYVENGINGENKLDLTNMVVTAYYDNGSSAPVTGYDTSIADGAELTEEDTEVVVTYAETYGEDKVEMTATLAITVLPKAVSDFEVTKYKDVYPERTAFDKASVILKVTYNDGEVKENVDPEDTALAVTPAVLNKVGKTTVTIEYADIEKTVTVNVTARKPVDVVIDSAPEYIADGASLKNEDVKVLVTFDNNEKAYVTDFVIDPAVFNLPEDYDPAVEYKADFTVEYDGMTSEASKIKVLECAAEVNNEKFAFIDDALAAVEALIEKIEEAVEEVQEIIVKVIKNSTITKGRTFSSPKAKVSMEVPAGVTLEQNAPLAAEGTELNLNVDGTLKQNSDIVSSNGDIGMNIGENAKVEQAEDADIVVKDGTVKVENKSEDSVDLTVNGNDVTVEDTFEETVEPEVEEEEDEAYKIFEYQMMQWRNLKFYVFYKQTTGGTVEGLANARIGQTVEITITPDEGYKIVDVLVNGKSVGAVESYKIRNVKANTTVSAVFEKIAPVSPFVDVDVNAPYYDAVVYVYENGIINGVSETEMVFAPNTTMTRAMFVTVLGRMAGVDMADFADVTFADCEAGSWYAPFVEWAAQAGIVNGYSAESFGPMDEITVEQAAVILYRFAEYMGYSTAADADLANYADGAQVSEWAAEQMKWALANSIYTADTTLDPQTSAIRSLVAEMLYNLSVWMG